MQKGRKTSIKEGARVYQKGQMMTFMTETTKKILTHYESDCPGTKSNLARILSHGHLGGTGKLIIYPVDQGFEHGPGRSFSMNEGSYDPHYHFQLAIDGGLSAFAAPLGLLEAGASTFAGEIPLILKVNSGNSLVPGNEASDQAITGTVEDALRLGCSAIGFTIYPGVDQTYELYEEIQALAQEAKACGLAVIIWSYPRGHMSKAGETGLDTVAYGAHMAALLGAHIIKVKLPSEHIESEAARFAYEENVAAGALRDRVAHVVKSCFDGRRLVIFSGGEAKDEEAVFDDARAIRDGGGSGSIIGRNCFQRPRDETLALLKGMVRIYKGKDA